MATRPRGWCPCANNRGFLFWSRIPWIEIIPVTMSARTSAKRTQKLHRSDRGCFYRSWRRRARTRRSLVISSLQVSYVPCQFFDPSSKIVLRCRACGRIFFTPRHFVRQIIVFFLQVVVQVRHLLLGTSSGHLSFQIVVPPSEVVVHLSLQSASVRVLLQLRTQALKLLSQFINRISVSKKIKIEISLDT